MGNGSAGVRTGALVRVTRGVYCPAEPWRGLARWERYVVRVHAAAMRHPDLVFALDSAAALLGEPVFGDPMTVHAVSPDATSSRETGGVRMHVSAEERTIVEADGLLVCSRLDTVVDLARARHSAIGLSMADAALRHDPGLTREQFIGVNEARRSSRGRRRARWALERADAGAESALESVDRAVIAWLGFPAPELQVWLGRDRVDKWWPDLSVAGESDGDLKYDGTHGDARAAMRARHERDARLFSHGASAVPHWGWPEALAVDPLRAILRSAGLPVIRPPETAPLATLRRALSPGPRESN